MTHEPPQGVEGVGGTRRQGLVGHRYECQPQIYGQLHRGWTVAGVRTGINVHLEGVTRSDCPLEGLR